VAQVVANLQRSRGPSKQPRTSKAVANLRSNH